ncbi:MAG: FAD-dependent oxidoreductase [Anaerolineales bacterium]|nr:FAD-dependent oxidoreductase [Anaerolineales bacterium]MCB9110592.1 FAD-dependent oxidoreductase [Anaerolineales bacterium]
MNSKHDVLIIGGGPVGLSCAYYLLKSGRSVTLLDAKEIGKGSGSGNAGHIVPSHIIPLAAPGVVTSALKWMLDPEHSPFGMKVSLNPNYLMWLLKFTAACNEVNVTRNVKPLNDLGQLSAKNFAQIIAEEKFDCAYQEKGLLFLYKTEQAFHDGQHEGEFIQKHGIPVSVYDKPKLHEVEPAALDDVIGGVHFTGDAHLNPTMFLKLLRERVQSMGAELMDGTKVTGFEVANGKIVKIKTSAGDFEAEQVVLAAGALTPSVAKDLNLNIPVQPARGYSMTMSATKTMPSHALILGERKVAVSPMDGLLRFTARLEVGNYSMEPNPLWIRRIENAAREYLRLDEKLDVKETWAGLRPTTPDGVPIICKSPKHDNLVLVTGHAMLGLSLGPGTGQVVAELVNGYETAFDLSLLKLERF